ncbi:MAG: zinc transporter ZupT [Salibacteraceae bacterium]|jgi:zinc transporter ZupT
MVYFLLFTFVVVVAGGTVLFYQPKNNYFSKLLLSFSGAYLFALIFLHLLPEVYLDPAPSIGLYVLLGFLLQLGLDFISKGIEHGHAHHHGNKFPLAIFIGLCLHSFFEGMPILHHVHHGHSESLQMNHSLIWGIMIHKIPISIVLAGLLRSQFNISKSLLFLTLFAITLPLGSMTSLAVSQYIENVAAFEHIILSLVIGVMLHVSTTILYESDEAHKFNFQKVLSILVGFVIAYFTA